MNKLNAKQIIEIIDSKLFREFGHSPKFWMWEDVYETIDDIRAADFEQHSELENFITEFSKLGKFKMCDHFGGEGKGDTFYTVYHFIDHDVYLQFYGWYASHVGSEFSEIYEVEPVETVITDWKEKR